MAPAYLYWRLELKENGLRDEDLTGFRAEISDLGLEQLHLLAGSAAAYFEESVDDGV